MVLLPTWDFIITLAFVVTTVAALLLGRERISVVLIAMYVGLAVAGELGDAFFNFLQGSTLLAGYIWVKSNLSVFMVKTIVFTAIVVFLVSRGEFTAPQDISSRGLASVLVTAAYGFFLAGLLVTSFIFFLAQESQAAMFAASPLAEKVMGYRIWWLLVPLLIMVGSSMFRARRQPAPTS